MIDDANTYSQKIKKEADALLSNTQLRKLLEKFGEVDLGGSYAYDLMIDRDLDFGVEVTAVTSEIRAEIASTFAAQPWAYGFNMTDRVNFKPLSNLEAPLGLFLGLTIPFPVERWNVDVWFTLDEPSSKSEVSELVRQASADQRRAILEIKYELMKRGKQQKGITSAEVYKAVIQSGVFSYTEFLRTKNVLDN